MKNYKKTFASLQTFYLDGGEQYNFGGFVPPKVFASPSPTPSATTGLTPTPTPSTTPPLTPTQTTTPTQTITPTQTATQTLTPTPSATPPASGTTEANLYLSAVVDAGGTGITSPVSAATITLFTSLVSNNLFDKLTAFYPLLGGNSAGCKFNAKNPVDTNAAFRLEFNGGWTFNATGATSNGTNAYANTYLAPSANTLNSKHISIYMSDNSAPVGVGKTYIGVAGASPARYNVIGQDGTPNWFYGLSSVGNSIASLTIDTSGFIVAASSGATDNSLFRNSTRLQTFQNFNITEVNPPHYIAALNNNGVDQQYYANQYSFVSIGAGMTQAEVSTFTTIVNTFQTTLSRNTF